MNYATMIAKTVKTNQAVKIAKITAMNARKIANIVGGKCIFSILHGRE